MDFKVLFSQLVILFEKLTKQQKIIITSAIIGVIAFLIFLIVYTENKDKDNRFEPLFESLSASDASKVIAQLEKEEIPYKIEANNLIKVPKDVVYKERITIAALGIPKNNGVGFELFDTQEFGATNFDQKIKHLRALEGELSRTINALSPIESVSVSLALPKESLFISKQTAPTASVMVELVDGRRLSPKQIRGIKNLVSASIPKMSSSDVMLVNSDGETLGDEEEMAQMGELSIIQQHFKNKEEKKRQEKIIQVISPFVGGIDKIVAQVTIEYDFSIQSSTSEKFDPENVVRSEQTNEEKREGSSPVQIGGVPGTVSNIGPVQGLDNKQSKEKYTKSTGTTNYEISKTVSSTKSQFARIKRVTAAVLVDGQYKYKVDDKGVELDELEYQALSDSDIVALTALVSQAIGIDSDRGDKITVQNLQFQRKNDTIDENGVTKAVSFAQTYLIPFAELFKYIFVAILLLILYKKVITPFAERMLTVTKEDDEFIKPKLDLDEDEEDDLVERVQAMRKKVEGQLGFGENLNEDELKHDVILEKLKLMLDDNPKEIAALLQALLEETDGIANSEKG